MDHEAGRKVAVAHAVEIVGDSRLAQVVGLASTSGAEARLDEEAAIAALEALRHPKPALSESALPKPVLPQSVHPKSVLLKPVHQPGTIVIPVNSSHHQSANAVGQGLRIVARCPDDGIIEALEGTAPDHFVVAVQWHPERSVAEDAASRAIFEALIEAARQHRGAREIPSTSLRAGLSSA